MREALTPALGPMRSFDVAAAADRRTESAEDCIVATSATRRSGASTGPAKSSTVRGKSSAGGPPTARAARGACGQERGPHVAADGMRKSHEHEEREDVAPREPRAGGKGEERSGRGRHGEGSRGERQRDGKQSEHHEAELQEVGPDDRALAAECRVRDEEGRRQNEDARRLPGGGRDDDDLRRFREEREPDDLGEDDEKSRDLPDAGPVRSSDHLRDRRRRGGADAGREKKAEREEAEGSREIEPQRGEPLRGHEGGEDEGRGPADHGGGERRPRGERAETAVADEKRVGRTRGVPRREEADEEDGGPVKGESGGQSLALSPRARRPRGSRAASREDHRTRP